MAPSPSRSASSDEGTSSGSSEHDDVEQQPARPAEEQNAVSDEDDNDSDGEESGEEKGENVAEPKLPQPGSKDVVPDSESEDDNASDGEESDEEKGENVAEPKLPQPGSNDVVPDSESEDDAVPRKKAPSPSTNVSSSAEDEDSSGSGDEEESDEKEEEGTESNCEEALPPMPAPVPKESLPVAADLTVKPQRKRKPLSTPQSPQQKRIRSAEAAQHVLLPRSDVDKIFEEKCHVYPFLGQEVVALEAKYPSMMKVAFLNMEEDKAKELDAKIHNQQVAEMRAYLQWGDIKEEVTNTILNMLQ